MPKYTIKNSMPSGKNDPQWGPEYRFQLEEVTGDFKTNFKQEPQAGEAIYGTIETGKFGPWFKRGKKEDSPTTSAPTKSEYSPENKAAREDGMKQGMCINNAANYVKELGVDIFEPSEWAVKVHSYASALYGLGDLVEKTADGVNVKEIFV